MPAPNPGALAIEGDLTIYTAAQWRETVLAALEAEPGQALEIDLGGVTEIDSAGLQVLIAAKKEAQRRDTALHLAQHSGAVRELLELFRLESYFGDPVVLPARN